MESLKWGVRDERSHGLVTGEKKERWMQLGWSRKLEKGDRWITGLGIDKSMRPQLSAKPVVFDLIGCLCLFS